MVKTDKMERHRQVFDALAAGFDAGLAREIAAQRDKGGEVKELEKLLAIEEIKRLKAKYFYGIDTKDWELWRREVFAPDGRLIVPEADFEAAGIEAIIETVARRTDKQDSVHHGHMADIEILSDSTAQGIWAMEDRLYRAPGHPMEDGTIYLHGFGHYHETYICLATGWRIQSTRLSRLRVERRKEP